ncbi:MAG: winged helix-turn-helix domain-containing protein [Candidatus Limnocylindria bacterium]
MPPLAIGADHARRFLVRRHLLAPPRSLTPRPQSVLEVVERLGLLQFDPLEVPGARNHDLVLHARIRGYRREWCERWLYGRDRRLIELYNKSLNIVPMHELPHYRITWRRYGASVDKGILKDQAAVSEAILAKLKTDGPLSTAAFSEHGHAVDWWWAPTRASRAVMEALFVAGRIGISRREGNRRYYDLMERLVPAVQLKLKEPEEDAMTHRLLSRFRATGMTTTIGTQGEVMYSAGSQSERIARTERLVANGDLLPIEVEGFKRPQYIIASEAPILRATAKPGSLPPPAVAFLAPLDPLVWDRKMLRALWSFDYLWEVYVPEAKRKWGYYVLPVLFGDRFVGRIEPRIDRKAGVLNILGIWFQPGFAPLEEPGFVAALSDALDAYRDFVGATKVTWPRTRAGREMAAALRRLA